MKKIFLVFLLTGYLFLSNGCASKYYLTVEDVEPKMVYIMENPDQYGFADADGFVMYYAIGDPKFDDFFMTAAKIDGLVILTSALVTESTTQLKNFAMSKASNEALKENIKELVGDTPPDEWTTDQSIAVMEMSKKQGEISDDEKAYFVTTGIMLAAGSYSLGKGVKETADLIKTGAILIKDVKKVKPWLVPATTKALKGSVENLKGIAQNAPGLLEEVVVLSKGFKALSN